MASPSPSPTPTLTGGNNNTSSGPTSSPLLFFVALGFGVVFTNLWIIVGVKYCFRYNARQRRRANSEEETVDLQAMPRPHRRRREKKLMSLDEVNERFPATQYKSWRAQREHMGLPVEGGIKTPPNSRPPSLSGVASTASAMEICRAPPSVDALAKEVTLPSALDKETSPPLNTDERPTPNVEETPPPPLNTADEKSDPNDTSSLDSARKRLSDISEPDRRKGDEEEDEEDDHDQVQTAVPDELLNSVGDSCAICLDTIEEDDDIRGLTCGHAFHAGCLDPWLTSRRACCPLCKADYYVPKPRPEGETVNSDDQARPHRHRRGANATPMPPNPAHLPLSTRRIFFLPGRLAVPAHSSNTQNRGRRTNRVTPPSGSQPASSTGRSWMRNPLRSISLPFRGRSSNANETPSPATLEAGLVDNRSTTPVTTPAPNPLQGAVTR